MGATASAPFKAMSMTNGNVNRSFGVGPSTNTPSTNVSAVSTNVPLARRNRRTNAMMMMGGKRRATRKSRRGTRKSRKATYRRRR